MPNESPPDALLLLTQSCAFCPAMLESLSHLVKAGHIGKLEVVNIERHPEAAQERGVRSVPWVKLGPFELDGLRTQAELALWAERAGTAEGVAEYVRELLATGGLKKLIELVTRDPVYLDALPILLVDADAELQVRLGLGALMEELQNQPVLARLVAPLGKLTEDERAPIRSDACHYLALSGNLKALPYVERLLQDSDETVREVAQESLASLQNKT
jgi:hypothetical protein